ncbi:Friend virus susceptibility protein 1-like [Echinops telfairi]|uniref:Friend virus susceptibility protein 1-like n=1 Tax=Echinops telfairi TaxID=9371 RepID=A0AC55D0D2_ECHTE|nr:Friend virus susceptibility protein 1-like [Echinops telfairi]
MRAMPSAMDMAQCFRQHTDTDRQEPMVTWILRVYDQRGQVLSLTSAEMATLGYLTSNSLFNYYLRTLQGSCQPLLTWLLRAWRKRWPVLSDFRASEMDLQPWATLEGGIQLVRELGMLSWIYQDPPSAPYPEDVALTLDLRRLLLTMAPEELRPTLLAMLAAKGQTVMKAMEALQTCVEVDLLARRSQPHCCQGLLGPRPTLKELIGWLLGQGIPREQVEKQPTRVLLERYLREARLIGGQPAQGPPQKQFLPLTYGEEPPKSTN